MNGVPHQKIGPGHSHGRNSVDALLATLMAVILAARHNDLMVRKRLKHPKPDTQMGRALARWESEGGALQASPPSARDGADVLAEPERHVLERLGAAVVIAWNDLPTDVQRTIFR